MIAYWVTIFEGEEKKMVLSHVFYGKTKKEVLGIYEAHMKTDSFFRAAVSTGEWRGIPLSTEVKIDRI